MPVNNNFPYVPENVRLEESYLRELKKIANQCVKGKTNNAGEITLDASEDFTIIKNILCTENSVVLTMPCSLAAAVEVADGTFYIVAGAGFFTVYHDNSAVTDRVFKYIIVG